MIRDYKITIWDYIMCDRDCYNFIVSIYYGAFVSFILMFIVSFMVIFNV